MTLSIEAEHCYAESHTQVSYSECHCAECHCAECRYAEGRGAQISGADYQVRNRVGRQNRRLKSAAEIGG